MPRFVVQTQIISQLSTFWVLRVNRTAATRKVVFVWRALHSQTDSTLSQDVYFPNNRGISLRGDELISDIHKPISSLGQQRYYSNYLAKEKWIFVFENEMSFVKFFSASSLERNCSRNGMDRSLCLNTAGLKMFNLTEIFLIYFGKVWEFSLTLVSIALEEFLNWIFKDILNLSVAQRT